MRLTANMVEAAFIATAREQINGEPFDWRRCAEHLNRLAESPRERAPFLLGADK